MNRDLTRCQPRSSLDTLTRSWKTALSSLGYYRAGAVLLLGLLAIGLPHLPVHSQENGTPPNRSTTNPNARPILKLGSQGNEVTELQAILKLLGYYSGPTDGIYQESTATAVSAFQQAAGLQPDGIAGAETWSRLLPAPTAINPAGNAAGTNPTATQTPGLGTPAATAPNIATSPAPTGPAASFPTPTVTPTPAPQTAPSNANPGTAPAVTPSPAGSYTPITPSTPAPSSGSSTAAAPAATVPSSTEFPILKLGMQGEAVSQLQERLKATGFFTGTVDGVFGAETQTAVQEAQRRYNLEADGVVGPATWAALTQGN